MSAEAGYGLGVDAQLLLVSTISAMWEVCGCNVSKAGCFLSSRPSRVYVDYFYVGLFWLLESIK